NQIEQKCVFPDYNISLEKAIVLRKGTDINVFSSGDLIYEAYEAVNLLNENNIKAGLIYFPIVLPIDRTIIIETAINSKMIVTVEEHGNIGGFGSIVENIVKEVKNVDLRFMKIGINDFCLNDRYGT